LLKNGQLNSLYDPTSFNAAMQASGITGIYDIYDANAPILVAATFPLAWWPPMLSRAIWMWFNLGLVLLVAVCFYKLFGKRNLGCLALILAAMLLYAPLQENFRLGQIYLPFLLAASLCLVGSAKLGSGAVGLIVQLVIKLYYGLFGLIWVIAKPRTVILAVTVLAALALVLLPWFGLGLWWQYLTLATTFNQRPYISVTAYQTLHGFFSHLFRYEPTWNPHPLADMGGLADVLSATFTLLILVVTGSVLWRFRNRQKANWGQIWGGSGSGLQGVVALTLSLAPVLAPAAEEYHFTLLLVPLFVSVKLWLENKNRHTSDLILWLLVVLLLGIAWPYKKWGADGWQAFVVYPRLYGALILWVLLLKLVAATAHEQSSAVDKSRTFALVLKTIKISARTRRYKWSRAKVGKKKEKLGQ
jgi:hypothetical protein